MRTHQIVPGSAAVVAMALALAASGPWSSLATAATHYVAKDGTGQFTVIQDALDAAAPGDTIRIGAGRYDEFREYVQLGAALLIHVQTADLTIVGADRDSVLVGPQDHVGSVNGRVALGMLVLEGIAGTTISGVTLENTSIGATVFHGIHMIDCTVSGASDALVALSGAVGTVIESSLFEWTLEHGQVTAITSFVGQQVPRTVVRNCEFRGERGTGVQLQDGDDSIVEGCVFEGANIGVNLYYSTGVLINDCTFSGAQNATINVAESSEATITNCRLGAAQYRGIQVRASAARVEQSAVDGGAFGAIVLVGGVDVLMRDCDISNAIGPHVYSEAPAVFTNRLDLRYNFWGSADSVEVAGWIDDGADDGPGDCTLSYCPRDTVQFWPVLERSVEAKPSSVGSFKSRFRRD